MSRIDDLAREIALLRRDVRNARLEAADAAVSSAQRRHSAKLAVVEADTRAAWRRLDPDTTLLRWRPRAGEAVDVDIGSGLLERLRAADPVADSLGNTDPFIGQTNLLDDPTFEQYVAAQTTLTTTEAALSNVVYVGATASVWFGQQIGATAVVCKTYAGALRRWMVADNSFNTDAVRFDMVASSTGTHEMRLRSTSWNNGSLPRLPYLVAAIRIADLQSNLDDVSPRSFILEIYDQTSGVVRASASIDPLAVFPDGDATAIRLSTALLLSGQSWEFHQFRWRLRLVLTTTGAGSAKYWIGEPQLHMSYSPDPAPFQPLIGTWAPSILTNLRENFTQPIIVTRRYSDPVDYRFYVDNSGGIQWGSGAADLDAMLYRVGPSRMHLSSPSEEPASLEVTDIVPHLAASWVITYNGDGTVASATRSGDAGAATTTITYAGSQVSSIVSVRAGRTVTVTPTYTAGKITSLARSVV